MENLAGEPTISICHLASGDRWAGAEVQVRNLLCSLSQNRRLSLCAIFLNEGRLAEESRRCGLEVLVLPESQMGFWRIVSEASKFLKDRRIHVLHSHRYKENFLAALLSWRCRIPCVVRTQHGMPEPFRGIKRLKTSMAHILDHFVARYATDLTISVSDEMRTQLTRSLNPEKVVTVQNGIDLCEVRSGLTPAQAKRALGIAEKCRVLGTVGRLDPVKRLDIFLAAARVVLNRFPDTRFIVAGEGSEKDRLLAIARREGLGDRVLFLGHRDDVYDVMRALDIFVLCSDHEGLPTALLEALNLGLVVVARRVGGIPEVVRNGHNGVLLETADPQALAEACIRCLEEDVLRQEFALAGPAVIADHFSSARSAETVARLYESLSPK